MPRPDARPSAYVRGYGERHEAWRVAVLTRDNWTCQKCGHVCWERRNAHADHVSPVVHGTDVCEDGRSRFDPDVGQCLCGTCHRQKTAIERTSRARDAGTAAADRGSRSERGTIDGAQGGRGAKSLGPMR